DSTALIADGHRVKDLLVDQGTADGFLQEGLRPWLLEVACVSAGIPLELHMRDGYDHSYNFVSTFMAQHISWHAQRLTP
ncbi:S-formylglutathione hydrolase, partial [Cupriavidus sp. 2MCAB6]